MAEKSPGMQLAPRLEVFVREYLVDYDGTRAAIAAGYAPKGAGTRASQLLAQPAIQALIRRRTEERCARLEVDADMVIQGLAQLATFDPAELFDADGNMRALTDIPPIVRRALAGIDVEALYDGKGKDAKVIGSTLKVKLADKVRAYELLGKNLKLFTDVHEHRGLEGLADRLAAARARAKAPKQ